MKYISVILIIIIHHITAYAQRNISLPFSTSYNEHALFSFGIQYNYVYQKYQLRLKENWQQDYPIDYPEEDILYLGNLKSIQSKPGSGFSVGIPIDIRIHEFIYINVTPSFLFINNLGITYESSDVALAPLVRKTQHTLSSKEGKNFNALEVPIQLKWRSEEKGKSYKENRYRGYFTTGIRYTKWLGLQKAYFTDNNITLTSPIVQRKEYFSWELGLGIDILFDTFKISPELKFSQSFHNVLDNTSRLSINNKFMTPIEKALIRNIYFGLIFQ